VQSVLDEFFVASDEGYKNLRADLEIREYHAFIEKQRNNGKLGGRPKKTQRKPTANPDQSQKKPNQEPVTINHKPKNIATVVACPPDFDESLWQDWLKIRKSKKAPLTETAWKLFVNETGKAGWTIENAIQECCLRNWASFKAEWVADKQPQGTSFRERDEAEKRRKWEEMTGRKWPTENNTTFIEAETNFLEIGHD